MNAVAPGLQRFVPHEILLIEDNDDHIELARQSLLQTGIDHVLHVAAGGEEALALLRRPEHPVRPHLILLDLGMPTMSGHEFLDEVKGDPLLRSIPIVILTCSDTAEDVKKAYWHACNAYVIKPPEFDRFVEMIRINCLFWFRHARLPLPRRMTDDGLTTT